MRWMEYAWEDIGEKEIAGAGHNATILGYFAQVGRADVTNDETAWCAAFVGACLERAGIRSTRSLMARSYVKFGTDLKLQPRVGAIGVIPRGADKRFGHVFFIDGWTETHVIALGGNQSNAVTRMRVERSKLIYVGWPEPPKTPAEVEKSGSRIARAATDQKRDASIATGAGVSDAVVPAPPPAADFPSVTDAAGQATAWKSAVSTLMDVAVFAWAKWPWIAAAIALYFGARAVWAAVKIRLYRTEDENSGRHEARRPEPSDEAADEIEVQAEADTEPAHA
jgi:uncharacterized protein (TIGR02594 family)